MSSTLSINRQHVFLIEVENNQLILLKHPPNFYCQHNTTVGHKRWPPFKALMTVTINFTGNPSRIRKSPDLLNAIFITRFLRFSVGNKNFCYCLVIVIRPFLSMRIRCDFAEAEALTDLNRWIGCTGLAMSHGDGIARLCACMYASIVHK